MSELVLCCGKVCSGKTRFALHLKEKYGFFHFSADKWMLHLYGQISDRVEFDDKVHKCKLLINELAKQILDCGINVVMDYGFWTENDRKEYRNNELFKKHQVSIVYLKVTEEEQEEYCEIRNGKNDKESYQFSKKELIEFNNKFEEPKSNYESIEEYCIKKRIEYTI